jgi:hypothetical protein
MNMARSILRVLSASNVEPDETLAATDESPPERGRGAGALVGACSDALHPTLQGRVKVRWCSADGTPCERWLPTLQALTVRAGDRVLMMQPQDQDEPIVIGVVDGFAQRPERPSLRGPLLELARDEALQIRGPSGEQLLELRWSEGGPIVKLLSGDTDLHLAGTLKISAESISLKARQGEVAIAASDDVIVRGATVRLN